MCVFGDPRRGLPELRARSDFGSVRHFTTTVERSILQIFKEHEMSRRSWKTGEHRPWKIETAIAFRSEAEARRFERYLKTGSPQKYPLAPPRGHWNGFAAPLERAQNLPSVTAQAVQLVQLNATILAEALLLSQPL